MLVEVCEFYGLNSEEFTLVQPNRHDIMNLNSNDDH